MERYIQKQNYPSVAEQLRAVRDAWESAWIRAVSLSPEVDEVDQSTVGWGDWEAQWLEDDTEVDELPAPADAPVPRGWEEVEA